MPNKRESDLGQLISKLREFEKCLGLESWTELGMVFGIKDRPGLTVYNWLNGGKPEDNTAPFNAEHRSRVNKAHSALRYLCGRFSASRLREMLRCNSEQSRRIFRGKRPLDMILEGQIEEVVRLYKDLYYKPHTAKSKR